MSAETTDNLRPPRPAYRQAYRQAESLKSAEERDAEITRHLGLVHSVVERLAAHLPPTVDRDDLFHAGVIGLIDAIDRFDAGRHNAFSTYAVLRIRGAIIDELRARDWVPRGARNRHREYHQTVAELFQDLGRIPEAQEIADRLAIQVDEVAGLERDAHLAAQVSLDTPIGDGGSLGHVLADRQRPSDNPARNLEREDQRRILIEVLSSLKEQERIILKLYYFEGLLMKDVAEIMGVTESRICQIHRRLMTVLRCRLQQAGFA